MSAIFTTTYQLPPLKYAYDALEPSIDQETMTIHHTKHHQAYTNNTNAALKTISQGLEASNRGGHAAAFGETSVDALLRRIAREDAGIIPRNDAAWNGTRMAVRNHGGGFVNHELFFSNMAPGNKVLSDGVLLKAITAQFGSVDAFRKEFVEAGAKVFGSGWAFLVYIPASKTLRIVSTPNQDIPEFVSGLAGSDCVSILALDVWEHAYYLKFKNVRGSYLDAWWSVVDWSDVQERYVSAVQSSAKL